MLSLNELHELTNKGSDQHERRGSYFVRLRTNELASQHSRWSARYFVNSSTSSNRPLNKGAA